MNIPALLRTHGVQAVLFPAGREFIPNYVEGVHLFASPEAARAFAKQAENDGLDIAIRETASMSPGRRIETMDDYRDYPDSFAFIAYYAIKFETFSADHLDDLDLDHEDVMEALDDFQRHGTSAITLAEYR